MMFVAHVTLNFAIYYFRYSFILCAHSFQLFCIFSMTAKEDLVESNMSGNGQQITTTTITTNDQQQPPPDYETSIKNENEPEEIEDEIGKKEGIFIY